MFPKPKKLHGIVIFDNQFSIQKNWRETKRLKGKSISGGIQLKGGGGKMKLEGISKSGGNEKKRIVTKIQIRRKMFNFNSLLFVTRVTLDHFF